MRAPLLALAASLALASCARTSPPRLTPLSAKITRISPAGLDLLVTLEAENPNGFTISASAVTAKVTLDGKIDAGTVTTKQAISLGGHSKTNVDVPFTTPWRDVASVAALGAAGRDVPYAVDGSATLGSEWLTVDVPFHITGTITREQLVQAAVGSLPHIFPLLPTAPGAR